MKLKYRAINVNGELVTGQITADDDRAAIRSLRRQGLNPLEIFEDVDKRHRAPMRRPQRSVVTMAIHQLTVLLKAGISLDEAVSSLAETTTHPFIAYELDSISTKLRRGQSFSEALSETKLELPPYLLQLVRAGELTGRLPHALSDAVQQMEYELRTANEIRNALIYPAILVVSGIVAVLLMFTLVVPKFTKLLEKSDAEVPLLGQIILTTGQFFNDNALLVSTVFGALLIAGTLVYSNGRMRSLAWDWAIEVPLIGPWLRESDIGRWSTMLATLLNSRIELTKALELAQEGVNGNRLRSNLRQVTKAVRGGSSLAEALQGTNSITPTGYGLIKVGQESGELPLMLKSLATLYEESSRNRMKRFLTILEPVAILTIGGVIGLIMTGIMLAITSVHNVTL